jgi:hypothetical protein
MIITILLLPLGHISFSGNVKFGLRWIIGGTNLKKLEEN